MDRSVIWTNSGLNDLKAVFDFIARDSRNYATAFVNEVQSSARSLHHFGERGRIVPEFASSSIREIFIRKYRLIYHLDDHRISLLAFIHGARDLSALWQHEQRPSPGQLP